MQQCLESRNSHFLPTIEYNNEKVSHDKYIPINTSILPKFLSPKQVEKKQTTTFNMISLNLPYSNALYTILSLQSPLILFSSKLYTQGDRSGNFGYSAGGSLYHTDLLMLSVRNLRKTFTDATESSGVEFR